jgi:hypothetical protein
LVAHVGHQFNVNTTILRTSGSGTVAGYLLILARFFQVWLLRGLPRSADHPVYFGSAVLFAVIEALKKEALGRYSKGHVSCR